MTQPAPATFADGDVRIEPENRAVAVKLPNQPGAWAIVSADQGLRIASQWEADAVASWPALARTQPPEQRPAE